MATIELTEANLEQTITNNDIVVIDFWAQWCGPCRSFAPIYETTSKKDEYAGIVFGKVNTQEEQNLAAQFQIRSIPTLMIFREQIIIFSQAGSLPARGLEEVINTAKGLDMDMVRKEVAKQEQQATA